YVFGIFSLSLIPPPPRSTLFPYTTLFRSVVVGRERFTLRQVVADCGATLVGAKIWKRYGRWPVYSKFFDNMGPIPHHMHQNAKQDRKSTRLNSSHLGISYAVFCLKKKKQI